MTEINDQRLAKIKDAAQNTGLYQRLSDFLVSGGDIVDPEAAQLQIVDFVLYQYISINGVYRGWNIDYEHLDHKGKHVHRYLEVDPNQETNASSLLTVDPEQFDAVRQFSRLEGVDLTTIFNYYGIDRGLYALYRSRNIDPYKANIQIEAVAKLPPELTPTQAGLIVVGLMYTNNQGKREPEAFYLEPGGGFTPDILLHQRQYQVLEQVATNIDVLR